MKPHTLSPTLKLLLQERSPLGLAAGAWLGGLTFYLWPTDPPLALGLLPMGLGVIALAWYRLATLAILLLMAGVLWALAWVQVNTHQPLPWAAASRHSAWAVGIVQEVRPQPENPKRVTLILNPVKILKLEGASPATLRVGVWASQVAALQPGSGVAIPVKLIPPAGPSMPTQRDGRLWQWLNPQSAAAYATGRVEPSADVGRYLPDESSPLAWMQTLIAQTRLAIIAHTKAIGQGLPTALLVGDQSAIPQTVQQAFRATGLSHLLAISGMQLTLVGIGLFWLLRRAGATIPTLALRLNLKLWAAAGAMLGVGFYTLLAGASPGVVRAALMVGLVLMAVLLGRVRGTLRAWVWANIAILAINPALAMSAGLQLSSAATLALALWAYTEHRPHTAAQLLRAMLLSTLIAGAATAPIAVLHFGTQTALSLIANAVAIPLMTIATYAGFVALALWPFGLQNLALMPLEWFTTLTATWATTLANLQPALSPTLPGWAAIPLALHAMLALYLTIQRQWLWLLCITTISTALLFAWNATVAPPRIVVAADAEAAFLRLNTTTYRVLWGESPATTTRLARLGRLPLEASPTQPIPCCAENAFLPPAMPEFFAYAMQTDGARWQIQPHSCGRVWQRIAESCQALAASNPDAAPNTPKESQAE